jgi:bifunctional non-homologous end joining protein LigD
LQRVLKRVARLRSQSCILDGEAVVCRNDGVASFDLISNWRNGASAFLYCFDLIELNGDDLRRDPIERRKVDLARTLAKAGNGIVLNEHIQGDGELIFRHACKLGCEGIVSKRKGSSYRSGRSPDWIKSKDPASPAVQREAEEDWGR